MRVMRYLLDSFVGWEGVGREWGVCGERVGSVWGWSGDGVFIWGWLLGVSFID